MKYTTTEKELLAIILCLKECKKILYGAREINFYTDHKNSTFNIFSVKQALQWRTYIDQFGVDLTYIEEKKNVLVDCFSRLSRIEPSSKEGRRSSSPQTVMEFNQDVSFNDNGSWNQKRKREGTFIDFKKLETTKLTVRVITILFHFVAHGTMAAESVASPSSSILSMQYDPLFGNPNRIVQIFNKKTKKEIRHYYLHHDAIGLTQLKSAAPPTNTNITANFTALAPINLTEGGNDLAASPDTKK